MSELQNDLVAVGDEADVAGSPQTVVPNPQRHLAALKALSPTLAFISGKLVPMYALSQPGALKFACPRRAA